MSSKVQTHFLSRSGEDPAESKGNTVRKDELLVEIEEALKGLQFGEIKLVVRDGRIVQIERIMRKRLAIGK
jgi:hypothetical protein